MTTLFKPCQFGAFHLYNRIVMPRLTPVQSSRPGDAPNVLMAEGYTTYPVYHPGMQAEIAQCAA
ncbi:hypothetical protein TPL01_12120 [Sulfuriferula plumbiphila]|uniref:Uncharacterized protein n=1 Tax=Sulfuriferula plumbiphila TaxID=171865 RepID=A0A512L6G5_9PROT|nr:hypothetical protein [Sulfuriferula plumbiphila]BBP04801.1 hypothetical protein SFPGR_22230 [Sulfuriferula plumbiphila]GEP30074.1 hypothetical protein TPL01_12120 [Sulfuriferula plumbiphila]